MKKTKILKSKTAKIVAGVLTGCLLVGAVCGIMGVFKKDTTDTVHSMYAVGGLTDQGKYLETKESIYTKDAFACEGLKVTMDFDNNISYQVFYYDFDSNFIEKSAVLTENYKDGVPFNAQTARIVITPNEDDEISWLEIAGYANQLKVEVDKEQYASLEDKRLATYPKNVANLIGDLENVAFANGQGLYGASGFSTSNSSIWDVYTINGDLSNKLVVKVLTSALNAPDGQIGGSGTFYDSCGLLQKSSSVTFIDYDVLAVSGDYSFIVADTSSITTEVAMLVPTGYVGDLEIYIVD